MFSGIAPVMNQAKTRNSPAAMNVVIRSAFAGLPLASMRIIKIPMIDATRPAIV